LSARERSGTEPSPPAPQVVAERLGVIWRRIEGAGRDPYEIKVVAVTKSFGPGAVAAALEAGLSDVGENYADELLDKAAAVSGSLLGGGRVRWHYLGSIQRRRVKDLAGVVDCWQTVSRVAEGEAIVTRQGSKNVMVEVEATGLPGRNGCPAGSVAGLVGDLRSIGLDVRGLMTVGPPGPAELSRTAFRTTAQLADALDLVERSMGMSEDLEVAVQEGATMVRVGRALFGERPLREP